MTTRYLIRPSRTRDSEVAGAGATLNDDFMFLLLAKDAISLYYLIS
jgi:hypothetical protein